MAMLAFSNSAKKMFLSVHLTVSHSDFLRAASIVDGISVFIALHRPFVILPIVPSLNDPC